MEIDMDQEPIDTCRGGGGVTEIEAHNAAPPDCKTQNPTTGNGTIVSSVSDCSNSHHVRSPSQSSQRRAVHSVGTPPRVSPASLHSLDLNNTTSLSNRLTTGPITQASGASRGSSTPHKLVKTESSTSHSSNRSEHGPSITQISNHGHNTVSNIASAYGRLYGVVDRTEQPSKRQKLNSEDKPTFQSNKRSASSGTSGGVLTDPLATNGSAIDLHEGKKRLVKPSTPASVPVDLTKADDDLEVVSDSLMREVCYGMISTKVSAHQVPSHKLNAPSMGAEYWPPVHASLEKSKNPKNAVISVKDAYGSRFGNLESKSAHALAPVMDSPVVGIRLQAWIDGRPKKPHEVLGDPCSIAYDMKINVYGAEKFAEQIGRHFTQHEIALRTPRQLLRGFVVINPHVKANAAKGASATSSQSVASRFGTRSLQTSRSVEEIRTDVMSMFDTLTRSTNLPEVSVDPRVLTQLMSHQKQGLGFMLNKEMPRTFGSNESDNNSLWRIRDTGLGQRSVYYNVVSAHSVKDEPAEVLGGILADEMGLGKSLSILSLIVTSHAQSLEWSSQSLGGSVPNTTRAKTTLLVAPLSTLANWEQEIKDHLTPKTLTYYVYHGATRNKDVDHLSQFDVVLTTYNILSSDYGIQRRGVKPGLNPMEQIEWFRIVLDEAHTIREQNTQSSKAVCALPANRRWAVTGTPVQNKLDDFGTLLKFLRLEPFESQAGFQTYILAPFKHADTEVLPKLRILVDSVTLRRLRDRINLPPKQDAVVKLDMDSDERRVYNMFAAAARDKVNNLTNTEARNGKLGSKMYAQVLKSIMCLRLLCAHGEELLSEEDRQKLEGLNKSNAIQILDDSSGTDTFKARFTDKKAMETFILMREAADDLCRLCKQKVGDSLQDEADDVIGSVTSCCEIICNNCIASFQEQLNSAALLSPEKDNTICPICSETIENKPINITLNGIEAAERGKQFAGPQMRNIKNDGRYRGPHTKTKALLVALEAARLESLQIPDEPPIKSVVFSIWRSHLDLIEVALRTAGVKYVRLDGSMTRPKRNASIKAFREDLSIRVFLISTGAGGVGLNLTTASRVFLMEPMWNPAAEAQAVDRVYRIGQKRDVICTRYLMSNSFEEKMVELQQKKKNLADMSLASGSLDRPETAKEKLEHVRGLFK
ncbi:MAG: hypothetical protein M1814_004390 [Vezdaea aestivalis]|nr:MAG: hypothetical protein M1814_004390 [Vezdaea aestivalis]